MKKATVLIVLTWTLCVVLAQPCTTLAAEGGLGHYSPGAMASFIDAAPPGFVVLNLFNYYNGTAGGEKLLPFGGIVAANLELTTHADVFGFAYKAPFGILDGKFAVAALVPYVWAEVEAGVDLSSRRFPQLNRTVSQRDTADGIGDITLVPLWLAWNKGAFSWDVRLGIYAPTGDYSEGQLANVGLNYWTFEPVVSLSYLSPKTGLEVSAFAGLDFNTENEDTNYRSGDVFHLDLTVAQHLPLSTYGIIGIGCNAFYWEQFTGDSGSGATLGDFEGRTLGIGPVLSYVSPPIGGHTLLAEVKWLPELDVDHRLEGDYIWFKVALAF